MSQNIQSIAPKVQKKQQGFSLVEIALAMGILAFGLVTIVGLLPIGLDSFKESQQRTMMQQIGDRMAADVRQTPYDEIENIFFRWSDTGSWAGRMDRSFDVEGNQVDRVSERDVKVYQSVANVEDDTLGELIGSTFVIPGAGINPDVTAIRITVIYAPYGDVDPWQRWRQIQEQGDWYESFVFMANGVNSN
ncbi:MAG: Verru_Chthon cassette protein B [Verrucomicrobiota bacterium]